jgi:ABC-2 type transport system permease protein
MLVLAFAYGSVADSINDFVKDNQTLSDIIAAQGGGTILQQYLAMSFRVLALVATGFAIQSTLRPRSEEAAGRAELVLATPVPRARWVSSHLVLAFGGSALVLALVGVGFGVADAAVTGDAGAISDSLVGSLAFVPAVWVVVGVTVALLGFAPRAAAAAWAVLAVCFVIGMFGQLLDLPNWVNDLSPFQHVPPYPAEDLVALPLLVLLAVSAALTALGLTAFARRVLA